jgi:hypothetical protein
VSGRKLTSLLFSKMFSFRRAPKFLEERNAGVESEASEAILPQGEPETWSRAEDEQALWPARA